MEARRRAGAVLERRIVRIPDSLADTDYCWGVNYRSEKKMDSTISTDSNPAFTDKQIAVG
jgi:hypothetical protein